MQKERQKKQRVVKHKLTNNPTRFCFHTYFFFSNSYYVLSFLYLLTHSPQQVSIKFSQQTTLQNSQSTRSIYLGYYHLE